MLIRLNGTASFLLAWTCLLAACATHTHTATVLGTPCGDAGPRLNSAWRSLNEALQTPEGCAAENGLRCEGLRTQIERLSIDCPSNPDVIMANALLAFSRRDFVRTQQLLDELFSLAVSYPEAAELRARVALEQGNARFAVRFLDQQIRLHGDHPGMRETYASALYFVGRWDEAQAQLQIAKRLGAPLWRIAYAEGLIAEAKGGFAAAKSSYEQALQQRPSWKPAESRLRALIASGKVQ